MQAFCITHSDSHMEKNEDWASFKQFDYCATDNWSTFFTKHSNAFSTNIVFVNFLILSLPQTDFNFFNWK